MQPHPDVNAAETNHPGMRHGKGHRPYPMLLIGTAASYAAMYLIMYSMIDRPAHSTSTSATFT